MVETIVQEAALRCQELKPDKAEKITVDTVYFGGGTPSVLTMGEWLILWNGLQRYFYWTPACEVTVEANPEDLQPSYLDFLKSLGVNRLSIGIQSFNNEILKWMNRRHTAEKAVEAVEMAEKAGFDNINIDLIYGIPHMSLDDWYDQIEKANRLHTPHLSAYHLTIEKHTVFGVQQRKGKLRNIPEQESIAQYEMLTDKMQQFGFEHYEISNFAKPHFQSQHNSHYWEPNPYIGLGPSAHSFDGKSRRWNMANNGKYMAGVKNDPGIAAESWYEKEILTETDRYNEYVMTGLRTARGIDLTYIESHFSPVYGVCARSAMAPYVETRKMIKTGETQYRIAEAKWLIADTIMSDLFFV